MNLVIDHVFASFIVFAFRIESISFNVNSRQCLHPIYLQPWLSVASIQSELPQLEHWFAAGLRVMRSHQHRDHRRFSDTCT